MTPGPDTDGYQAEVAYPWHYTMEQEIFRQTVTAATAGVVAPRLDRPFTVLDLGSGTGLVSTVQASYFPHARFIAIDFDERVIDRGRAFARSVGVDNIEFRVASFADLGPNDLPLCDFIGAHGLLSWVSPAMRETIYQIADRHLAPGGLLYLSYDARAGNVGTVPWRRLWADHAARRDGPLGERYTEAFDAAEAIAQAGAPILRHWGDLTPPLTELKRLPADFLAHEYFGAWWEPLWLDAIARRLKRTGIGWIGQPCPTRAIEFRATPAQRAFAAAIPDRRLRETVLEMCVAPRFRPDLFYRGPIPENPVTHASRPSLHHVRFATTSSRDGVFDTDAERADARALTDAAGPAGRAWADIARITKIPAPRAIPVLRRLIFDRIVRPVRWALPPAGGSGPLTPINAGIARLAASGAPLHCLATPATGSIATLQPTDLVVLDAAQRVEPERVVDEALATLASTGAATHLPADPAARRAALDAAVRRMNEDVVPRIARFGSLSA